ncbi:hypothetical protein BGZ79_004398, partial [Entomortierella chlamydospora]
SGHNYKEDDSEDDNDDDDKDADFGEAKKKSKKGSSTGTTTTTPEVATSSSTSSKPALAKKGSEAKTPLRTGSHVNTTMPNPLVLPKTPEGCVKITSWNVSGLNASLKKVKKL